MLGQLHVIPGWVGYVPSQLVTNRATENENCPIPKSLSSKVVRQIVYFINLQQKYIIVTPLTTILWKHVVTFEPIKTPSRQQGEVPDDRAWRGIWPTFSRTGLAAPVRHLRAETSSGPARAVQPHSSIRHSGMSRRGEIFVKVSMNLNIYMLHLISDC